MKTLHISGLEKPTPIECAVRVLGDPRLSDPSVSNNIPKFQHLAAVSPGGQWIALIREGDKRGKIYTISRTDEGAEELTVPLNDKRWTRTRARDIADNGTFLFEANLNELCIDDRFSRRPLVFTPNNQELVILPPKYQEWEPDASYLEDNRPQSHTPDCFTPDGSVFGWTFPNQSQRQGLGCYATPHCIWRHQESDEWTIQYMPDFMNSKDLCPCPAYADTFVWCDRSAEDDIVHFGLFDGTAAKTYDDVSIEGQGTMIVSAANNSTFIGHFCVRDGRTGKDKAGKSKISSYTFLIQPTAKAGHVFNDLDRNPWLHRLSPNGQYIIGPHPGGGGFLMKAEGDGYHYATLTTRDWRIEGVTSVTDQGQVFAIATCTERKHSCFRLYLPIMLTPQW